MGDIVMEVSNGGHSDGGGGHSNGGHSDGGE